MDNKECIDDRVDGTDEYNPDVMPTNKVCIYFFLQNEVVCCQLA
jgi:hypothetical protein